MKKTASLLLLFALLLQMVGCTTPAPKEPTNPTEGNKIQEEPFTMTEETQLIVDLLGCDYVLFEEDANEAEIIAKFNELAAQGKTEGFYPLIVMPDDTLVETITYSLQHAGFELTAEGMASYRESVIEKASQIDGKAYLAAELEGFRTDNPGFYEAMLGEFQESPPQQGLSLYMLSYIDYEDIIIAKIPTANPLELAAWVPMGGWNNCPTPEQQVAVFHYWQEQYGAIPTVVGRDYWETSLTTPPTTNEAAEALAHEQFAFMGELESILGLAGSLKNATMWFFWWD